ncbi:MAG: ribbon-helix-helix domain-containing protein [Roseitalea sp.]|jgi:predicted DNA-binding ribbon-helix-helix protein|uniref:Aryl-sulfate sulfotransferase n=1 Tax=Oceaniradius stylonematis TaxID=2184161 RepID=A0A3A8A7C3_9HYPH|nr:ribbon-helix-helix domain-containing protein [Oceaniradius stylonematis]MBO6551468.1 ribbon-helix-helix domain-containing protein [Roseitalea sp.]MBO6952152.1 ribbon-helix-helix domain-containing protein [Rhizobiaceae bacterium]RNC95461.1 MAG: aryl-sulfate sulfotransferase [Oricola sp.]MBO6592002.1 ribbon-helix-helix domain-containing protein [Roseitalea sp.]MBO6598257.1 ribbon-helix-helix domain-containing protein [Roseitalea sp.]
MAVRKRSVSISGHRTSYSVEDPFQDALQALAEDEGLSLARLIARIDAQKPTDSNLSSALRLFVLDAAIAGRLTGPIPRSANEPRPR